MPSPVFHANGLDEDLPLSAHRLIGLSLRRPSRIEHLLRRVEDHTHQLKRRRTVPLANPDLVYGLECGMHFQSHRLSPCSGKDKEADTTNRTAQKLHVIGSIAKKGMRTNLPITLIPTS